MKPLIPLVSKKRIIEIIRGYIAEHATETTRPDMNNENHLFELSRLIVHEAMARIPLWELEMADSMKKASEQ
jgi:hypothetical protein